MKIQCDVCDDHEASVFCIADEAVLCAACDHRVHHANKLAGKHHRFSLHHPSAKQSPVCDICQEKRAFLFCQQDRAILCRDCDVSIHRANEHTQKHSRFLLTGLKLSPNSTVYSDTVLNPQNLMSRVSKDNKKTVLASPTNTQKNCDEIEGTTSSVSSSSISEYLIETLPGWHVEELLDSTNYTIPSPSGNLTKRGEDDMVMPFWDADLESNNLGAFGCIGKMGLWVPQVAPNLSQYSHQHVITQVAGGAPIGIKEMSNSKEFGSNITSNFNSSRKWSQQSSLVVPQMSPTASKRLRTTFC